MEIPTSSQLKTEIHLFFADLQPLPTFMKSFYDKALAIEGDVFRSVLQHRPHTRDFCFEGFGMLI